MATPFDLDETDRLLTTTRSVRKRLDFDRPVPRDLLLDCLRIAVQAPSGGNRQPWRWVVVDDPDQRDAIAALYRKSHDPYAVEQRKAAEQAGRAEETEPIASSSQYLSDNLERVPVLVFPCLLARVSEQPSVAEAAGFYGSILPAAWSFMLALRSRGVGAAWTTLHLAFESEAGEILGIPDTVTQVSMIPVAYYTGEDFRPAKRRPIEEITYFNGWKQR